MRLRIKTKRGYFPCQSTRTEQTEDDDTREGNPAATTEPAPRLSSAKEPQYLSCNGCMWPAGGGTHKRNNLWEKQPFMDWQCVSLWRYATEWDPPCVSSAAPSTPHFSIFLQERNSVVTCSFSISPCFRRNNKTLNPVSERADRSHWLYNLPV